MIIDYFYIFGYTFLKIDLSNFYSRRFSDYTDMGTWYHEQYKEFCDLKMLASRAQLFINLVELKYQFPELKLCKKINEATTLIIKNKVIKTNIIVSLYYFFYRVLLVFF